MRLRKFRVRAFRCIHDSGEIKVGDLAAFVGRNESGKTTILQGLTLLNKDENVSNLDLCDEMSEELKNEINIADGDFDLTINETQMIKDKFPNIPEIKKLRIFRTNKKQKIQYDFGPIKISNEENKALNSWENFAENILNFVETIPNHIRIRLDTTFFEGSLPESREIFDSQMREFGNTIHVLASEEPQIILEWEKVSKNADAAFDKMLVGTTELTALENFIEEYLHPRFVYFSDYKKISGNILSVVISDIHKDGTVTNTGLLNRRAEGFKWTFSFIVNFAAETQRAELKEAILLLDEPARNLHPTQQRGISDLLKNLAGSNQVLYATHSPFMIFDYTPGNLLVVELDKRKHLSKIYYDYWNASDETLTPILYGLSRGLVESIVDREIGSNSRPVIIVETMSDAMYLNAFDKFLEDPNISMNPLNVVAAYSKNSVLPLAIFYRDHGYKTFILLDNSEESKHISTQLTANDFSQVQTIFFEFGGQPKQAIEDFMVVEDYLYAVNQTYEIKLRKEGYRNLTPDDISAKGKKSILDNLNEIWKENQHLGWEKFEPEEICRYMSQKIALGEADFISDKTKDQFRTIFRLIAERIRQNQNIVTETTLNSLK